MTLAEAALEHAKTKGYNKFEVHLHGKVGDEKAGANIILIARVADELKIVYDGPNNTIRNRAAGINALIAAGALSGPPIGEAEIVDAERYAEEQKLIKDLFKLIGSAQPKDEDPQAAPTVLPGSKLVN